MAEFHVVIEGLKMSEAESQELNDAIQKVVLEHLANHDITTGRSPKGLVAFRPEPGWRGLVAQLVDQKQLAQLPAFQKSSLQPRG